MGRCSHAREGAGYTEAPEALAHAVRRCLEKDPESRLHVLDLARSLAAFAEDKGVASLDVLEREGALPRATLSPT
jgi:hypothetical protein